MDFSSTAVISGFVAATSGALAAYDGWNNLGFTGGEIKNPQKKYSKRFDMGFDHLHLSLPVYNTGILIHDADR